MNLSMRRSLTLEDTPSVPIAGRPQPTIRQILDNLFRAVVSDSFYGEDEGIKQRLGELGAGYVLVLKSHPSEALPAQGGRDRFTVGCDTSGRPSLAGCTPFWGWVKVTRPFKYGH